MSIKVNLNLDLHDKFLLKKEYNFSHSEDSNYILSKNRSGFLCLHIKQMEGFKPIYVDFFSTAHATRLSSGKHKDSLFKAVKINSQENISVLDPTAGFGRDAFLLFKYGFSVDLIERNPLVSALLQDGLNRFNSLKSDPLLENSISFLKQMDSLSFSSEKIYDVVYLDPMFPLSGKSSLVKKEFQFLQQVVGEDLDQNELICYFLNFARKKVVVKRPLAAVFLGNKKPNYSLKSKSIRFDIYLV